MLGRQTCKVCGHVDKFDFHVPDNIWETIVPEKYVNRVVCLACFDDFATEKDIDYSKYIDILYFAGDKGCFTFKATDKTDCPKGYCDSLL